MVVDDFVSVDINEDEEDKVDEADKKEESVTVRIGRSAFRRFLDLFQRRAVKKPEDVALEKCNDSEEKQVADLLLKES